MFVEERQEEILNLLKTEGKVSVNKLSEKYNLSKDLIRKDLRKLEKKGLAQRTYGGAILKRKENKEFVLENRLVQNLEIKEIIARKIFEKITDDETVFLDVSSINYIVAEKILNSSKRMTIITNMIKILNLFTKKHNNNVKIIGIGGNLNQINGSFMGAMSIEQIKKFKISKAFIGVAGVNVNLNQISTFDIEDGITKKAIIESSKESYIVCENTKFFIDGIYIFDNLENVDGIITNKFKNESLRKKIKENNLKLITI